MFTCHTHHVTTCVMFCSPVIPTLSLPVCVTFCLPVVYHVTTCMCDVLCSPCHCVCDVLCSPVIPTLSLPVCVMFFVFTCNTHPVTTCMCDVLCSPVKPSQSSLVAGGCFLPEVFSGCQWMSDAVPHFLFTFQFW